MYLSPGKAAKEAGAAKSATSKALPSGKLSYREKNPDGYKIDPAELFRVYSKTAKTDADEPSLNDWQLTQAGAETMPHSAKFETQLAGMVAVLGGLSQIFESLTHEGDPDCSRSARSGQPMPTPPPAAAQNPPLVPRARTVL
ncbi:MAG: hypothetical protein ACRD36_09070 [Candidatus Acidiferrum sp.]